MAPRSPQTKLTRIVRTGDGGDLRLLAEARAYMLALPEARAVRRAWQHAAALLLAGASIEAVTTQIEFALISDGKFVLAPRGDAVVIVPARRGERKSNRRV